MLFQMFLQRKVLMKKITLKLKAKTKLKWLQELFKKSTIFPLNHLFWFTSLSLSLSFFLTQLTNN